MRHVMLVGALVMANVAAGGERRICISGIYPHLAALSNRKTECGIGAVVPWADRLWFITYPAHYGDGKLYEVDNDLNLTLRPESIGGTHAGRLVHRESRQLVIGPYFIDQNRRIRSTKLRARITAVFRHLADPANLVYMFDMEGALFEVNVHDQSYRHLFQVQRKGVTGRHGKGGYTGQGVIVIANNGNGGGLAEWDGHDWKLVERKKFCEVTGPGGILGAPDDSDPDIPLWTTGWDHRSVILKVRYRGAWHDYRLPKASYTHDADHGWFTEWPRIREIGGARYLLDFHGMFFDFPGGFRPGQAAGIRPVAMHYRMVPDFCNWNGRLVLAADDTSVMGNPLGGQPQSNLWFGSYDELKNFGPPAGWGGPWVHDRVRPGKPSDPFLVAGFQKRVLHLLNESDREVNFTIETDRDGTGNWKTWKTVALGPRGYRFEVLPAELKAWWMRLVADKACKATAYFHFTNSGREPNGRLFRSIAAAGDDSPRSFGVLLPFDGRLWFLASRSDADGRALYEIDKDVVVRRCEVNAENEKRIARLTSLAPPADPEAKLYGKYLVTWDDASVVIRAGRKRYRLPKAREGFPQDHSQRLLREIVTERYLLNCCGLLYEIPRQDLGGLKPLAAHDKWIGDFCSWRGLLVIAGNRLDAAPDGHYFRADDGVGLWFGGIEDIWQFGKPRGVGGPWRNTSVQPGKPSDPYLMTGFDQKRLELSHDADRPVEFTIEVDFLKDGTWVTYDKIAVPPGGMVVHRFPDGFAAHWVRFRANRPCRATAWLTYQ